MCFFLINEKEESSKVSSIISINKPGYVEKLPFKPLPLKEEKKKKKKKKKKKSKRREETVSSPKHVVPIIVFADESKLDDVPMPVTYSSDHDWEKHSTFDIDTSGKKAIGGALFWLMRGAYGMRHHCHATSNNLSVAHFNMRHA
jgi:hypothetical protein